MENQDTGGLPQKKYQVPITVIPTYKILTRCVGMIVIAWIGSVSILSVVSSQNVVSFISSQVGQTWLSISKMATVVAKLRSNQYESALKSIFDKSKMMCVTDLPPDPEFVASKKYKNMEKYIRSKYDFEALRKDFVEKGYLIYKPDILESVIDGAAEFTKVCDANGDKQDFHQDRFTDIDAVRDIAQNYDIRVMRAVFHGYKPYPFQTLNYPLQA